MNLASARASAQAFVALLLACLVLQGTAVQTHVHFAKLSQPAATSSGGHAAQIGKPGKGSDPADCLLCQQAAAAGTYLLPHGVAVIGSARLVVSHAVSFVRAFDLVPPAPAWQSRAPPL